MKKNTYVLVSLLVLSTISSIAYLTPYLSIPPARAGGPEGDSQMILTCIGLIPSTPSCVSDTLAPFETIVYDLDSSGTFTTGDTVIVGAVPAAGQPLADEPNVRYRDTIADTGTTCCWDSGEAIFYDQDGVFTTTADRVFLIGAISFATTLVEDDPLVLFADDNGNGRLEGVVRITSRLEKLGGVHLDNTQEDVDGIQVIYTFNSGILSVMRASYPTGAFLPGGSTFKTPIRTHCSGSGGSPLDTIVVAPGEASASHACTQGPPRDPDVGIGCDPLITTTGVCPGIDLDGDGAGDVPLQDVDVTNLQFMITGRGVFTITHVRTPTTGSEIKDIDGTITADIPLQLINAEFDNRQANEPPTASFTFTPTKGTVDSPISFDGRGSTDTDGTIVSYSWTFGDGGIATGSTASHTYTAPGTYTVVLTVTDNGGASDTDTQMVTVNPVPNVPPTASFTFTPAKGTVGQAVSFDGTGSTDTDGTVISYSWDFGDGGTATGATATHTYATSGTFTVVLTVTDDDGASDTDTQMITVNPVPNVPPTASFTFSPAKGTVGQPISFDGMGSTDSDGAVVSYSWTFGDGGTATGATPSHTYNAPGTYTIVLTVTDDDGATDTDTQIVTVNPVPNVPPTASFTFTPAKGTVGQPVSFEGSGSTDSDGTIVSYSWTFGDGGTATGATTSHTYSTAGTFTVVLTVTDDDGASDTDTQTIMVNTVPNVPPTASFTFTPTKPTVGMSVSFDGRGSTDSDGTIVSYSWNFGDGGTATGSTATHTYTSPGTFTIVLTATDDDGATDTDTQMVTVNPVPNVPPTASFTFTPAKGTAGQPVSFDGIGSTDTDGTIVSYSWDFGDGNTGTGATTTHTYTAAGTYTVTLTVTDDDGAMDTDTQMITVNRAPNVPPTASFTFSPTKGTVDQPISFDGTGSTDTDGTIISYSWDFGDGNAGTGSTTSHTYTTAGTYMVTLTVTDNDGATDSDTQAVMVNVTLNNPPTASFTFSPTKPFVGDQVSFDGTGSSDTDGTIVSYSWTFGDGGTATGATATHTYTTSGTFTVVLTVTDDDGATDMDTQTITVNVVPNEPPVATFTFTPAKPFVRETVSFDGSGSFDTDGTIISYLWNFGDSGMGTGAMTTHSYTTPGTYTVTLTVTDDDGATDTDTQMITVNAVVKPPPVAELAIYDDAIAANRLLSGQILFVTEEYIFDSSQSSDPSGQTLTYMWEFGDGTTASGITVTHTYAVSGGFTVTLTVMNESGGSDSATVNVTVHNEPRLIRGKMSWKHHLVEGATQAFVGKATNEAGVNVMVKLKVVIESPAGTIVGIVESADTPLAPGETNLAITAAWTPAEYGDITARTVYQITGTLSYTAIDPLTGSMITGTDAQKTGSFAIVPA